MNDSQFGGIDFVHGQEVMHCFMEGFVCFQVSEIADVLADKHLASDNESDRIFQIAPYCENRIEGW